MIVAFPVFLDACTLVPINLTDVLLRLAEAHTYRPLWSAHVLDEVERTLPTIHTNMTAAKARQRVADMRTHFRDADVTGYESLIPAMTNDPKDRHVLAAALTGGAAIIVTPNLRDFSRAALQPHNIDAVHPDTFLLDQLDLYPEVTVRCLKELIEDRKRPALTLDAFLVQLARSVPHFADEVRHSRWA